MPKTERDYIHCIRCQVPLENPVIRRCETETWYIDFAACKDCKHEILGMENPVITLMLEGDILKTMLKTKPSEILLATSLSKEET